MTFERIKAASFTHSAVYAVLLVVWIVLWSLDVKSLRLAPAFPLMASVK